jgi:hypothetical protein
VAIEVGTLLRGVNLTLLFCVIAREAPPTAAIHLRLRLDCLYV